MKRTQIMPLVMADIEARVAKGAKEYGEPLSSHNGRDALWDAYEEALDQAMYLRQAIEERDSGEAPQSNSSSTLRRLLCRYALFGAGLLNMVFGESERAAICAAVAMTGFIVIQALRRGDE